MEKVVAIVVALAVLAVMVYISRKNKVKASNSKGGNSGPESNPDKK